MAAVTAPASAGQPEIVGSARDLEKHANVDERPTFKEGEDSDDSSFKQNGVRRVEEVTQVWSKSMLIVTFIL